MVPLVKILIPYFPLSLLSFPFWKLAFSSIIKDYPHTRLFHLQQLLLDFIQQLSLLYSNSTSIYSSNRSLTVTCWPVLVLCFLAVISLYSFWMYPIVQLLFKCLQFQNIGYLFPSLKSLFPSFPCTIFGSNFLLTVISNC